MGRILCFFGLHRWDVGTVPHKLQRYTAEGQPVHYYTLNYCVRCGKLMNRKMFKKISGVVIDVCRDHGVWLDEGELAQIRSFIANGGLAKYQEHLHEEILKNHRHIQKLAGEVNNVKFIQKMMNLYKPKYWLLKMF